MAAVTIRELDDSVRNGCAFAAQHGRGCPIGGFVTQMAATCLSRPATLATRKVKELKDLGLRSTIHGAPSDARRVLEMSGLR
jgi:hypothetical protein